jgi:hypothetical protein
MTKLIYGSFSDPLTTFDRLYIGKFSFAHVFDDFEKLARRELLKANFQGLVPVEQKAKLSHLVPTVVKLLMDLRSDKDKHRCYLAQQW